MHRTKWLAFNHFLGLGEAKHGGQSGAMSDNNERTRVRLNLRTLFRTFRLLTISARLRQCNPAVLKEVHDGYLVMRQPFMSIAVYCDF